MRTTTDVMAMLLEAIGIDRDSARFVVLIDRDRVGVVAGITRRLQELDINIRSLFAWPDRRHESVYHLVMRVSAENGERAVSALKAEGYTVLTEYVPDISSLL